MTTARQQSLQLILRTQGGTRDPRAHARVTLRNRGRAPNEKQPRRGRRGCKLCNQERGERLPLAALAALAWSLPALPGLLALLAWLLLAATALLTAAALVAALMLAALTALAALLAALVRIAHDRSCLKVRSPTRVNGCRALWFRQFLYHATGTGAGSTGEKAKLRRPAQHRHAHVTPYCLGQRLTFLARFGRIVAQLAQHARAWRGNLIINQNSQAGGLAMRKLAVGAVALATLGAPAIAADMGVRARYAPVVAYASWTGCHVGGLVGFRVERQLHFFLGSRSRRAST